MFPNCAALKLPENSNQGIKPKRKNKMTEALTDADSFLPLSWSWSLNWGTVSRVVILNMIINQARFPEP